MIKEIVIFKGFNKNLKCCDFQFEIGKIFYYDGKVEVCGFGFYVCECFFDVFSYYFFVDSCFVEIIFFGIIDCE